MILKSGVLDLNLSDHEMVYVVRKKIKATNESCSFEGRSHRNYNKEQFVRNLRDQNWENYETLINPNDIWQLFYNNILLSINTMCPLKTYNIRKIKEIWVTNEILEMINDKDIALRRAKRTRLDNDWRIARRLRNDCVSTIRKAKADFIQNELQENISDSKKFWKKIKNIIPNQAKGGDKIKLIDQDTGNIITESETADFINNFFYKCWAKSFKEYEEKMELSWKDS